MKNYLSIIDLTLWAILIAGKLVLCLCILKKSFARRLLWFSVFIFISFAKSLLLFAIAFWGSYAAYYNTYYVGSYIESALAFMTLIECGRYVLPGLDLPQKEKALSLLAVALAIVIIFSALWPLRSLVNEKRIELAAFLSVGIAFIFVAGYSRYLGLYWSRLLQGIASGLGMLYLVDGTAKAMIGHYPAASVLLVRQLSQVANVLVVIAWIIVILSPWGEQKMTEADLLKIEAAFARIEASLGKTTAESA